MKDLANMDNMVPSCFNMMPSSVWYSVKFTYVSPGNMFARFGLYSIISRIQRHRLKRLQYHSIRVSRVFILFVDNGFGFDSRKRFHYHDTSLGPVVVSALKISDYDGDPALMLDLDRQGGSNAVTR